MMRLSILCWAWGLGKWKGICTAALVVNLAVKRSSLHYIHFRPTESLFIADNFSKSQAPQIIFMIVNVYLLFIMLSLIHI